MISRESKTMPRNYYLVSTNESSSSPEIQVTNFDHPQPDLLGVTKELVHYKRKDGVNLTANLYLPANYDNTPRPTLFWAYPREFKNVKAAGQVKGSKHKFVSASWGSPIHWAAKGWAIMGKHIFINNLLGLHFSWSLNLTSRECHWSILYRWFLPSSHRGRKSSAQWYFHWTNCYGCNCCSGLCSISRCLRSKTLRSWRAFLWKLHDVSPFVPYQLICCRYWSIRSLQ